MPKKHNEATPGKKLLRMFRRLMINKKRHFLSDLSRYLECSPQTVMRMAHEIESVIGMSFESGIEGSKRWYLINSEEKNDAITQEDEQDINLIYQSLPENNFVIDVKFDDSVINFIFKPALAYIFQMLQDEHQKRLYIRMQITSMCKELSDNVFVIDVSFDDTILKLIFKPVVVYLFKMLLDEQEKTRLFIRVEIITPKNKRYQNKKNRHKEISNPQY